MTCHLAGLDEVHEQDALGSRACGDSHRAPCGQRPALEQDHSATCAVHLLRSASRGLSPRRGEDILTELIQRDVSHLGFQAAVVAMEDAIVFRRLAYIYDRYNALLREDNLLDYDDLLQHCLAMLQARPEVCGCVGRCICKRCQVHWLTCCPSCDRLALEVDRYVKSSGPQGSSAAMLCLLTL